MALKFSNSAVNGEADTLARLLDDGYLRVYDGTQPADADEAITTQVLLAELRFNATSAPAAVAGLLTFNSVTSDASSNNTGTASWARCLSSDGTSVVMDGSVGTSGTDFIINSVAVSSGVQVDCDAITLQVSKG